MAVEQDANANTLRQRIAKPAKATIHGIKKRIDPYNHTYIRWDFIGVFASFVWGVVAKIPLPGFLRVLLFRLWAWIYHARLEDMADPLESHKSLHEFFTRRIKPELRPICSIGVVSPVDGTVVSCGELIDGDKMEQVKGITYTTKEFFGPEYETVSKHQVNPDNKLFYLIAYLSPGDYHRFHSPVEWTIRRRKFFPGSLFPVNKVATKMIPSLFALNERVALFGEWEQGWFSYTPVGAFNVGSIVLHHEKRLRTNDLKRNFSTPNLRLLSFEGVGTFAYELNYEQDIPVKKGEELGLFTFGSTVVLAFEAHADFTFGVEAGQKIRLGEVLGV